MLFISTYKMLFMTKIQHIHIHTQDQKKSESILNDNIEMYVSHRSTFWVMSTFCFVSFQTSSTSPCFCVDDHWLGLYVSSTMIWCRYLCQKWFVYCKEFESINFASIETVNVFCESRILSYYQEISNTSKVNKSKKMRFSVYVFI